MAEIILGPGNQPAPSLLNQATAGKVPGVITTSTEQLFGMARKSSLWMLSFGLACCAIEMISTYMAHHDFDRFGVVTWPSPRQSDVMIVAGTVVKKWPSRFACSTNRCRIPSGLSLWAVAPPMAGRTTAPIPS